MSTNQKAAEADQDQDATVSIRVEGKLYTADDLTFREQRELRKAVRELAEDPDLDLMGAQMMDFLPALVWVIVKRENADFTIDNALDQSYDDVVPKDEKATNGRPTRSRAKAGA